MNIKMLKLYGWEDKFQQKITDDYSKEQALQETQRIPNAVVSIVNSLFN